MTNVIVVALGAIPLFFLPITQDFYDTNKWMLLVGITILTGIIWAISAVRRGYATVSLHSVTISLGLVTIASLFSLIISSTNKIEAIISPYGPVTFASLTFLSLVYLMWSSKQLLWSIITAVSLLGLLAVYQMAGMGNVMFPGIAYLKDPIWTPTGSLIASLSLLVIVLPILIGEIRDSVSKKHELSVALLTIMALSVVAGIGTSVWLLVPRLTHALLPLHFGWSILLEIFKQPVHALFGVGAENFLAAFSSGRPMQINMTPVWDVRFATNSSLMLHIATIYGLLGALAMGGLLVRFLNKPLFLGGLWMLLFPPNFSVLVVCVLILLTSPRDEKHKTTIPLRGLWTNILFLTIVLGITGIAFYGSGKIYMSELVYYQAMRATQRNQGTDAYNLLIRTVTLNPSVGKYHASYSQISLALAEALAKEMIENKNLTDDALQKNRDLVGQLIQQAIREAKIAVHLNPTSVLAWENLARTYQKLIGVAAEADVWATTTISEGMKRDPVNPLLALDLGGVFIKRQRYADAVTAIRRAVALKPDHVNAWYNLGFAYKLQGDIASAQKALERVIELVPQDSPEYRQVSEDLMNLDKPIEASPGGFIVSPPIELSPDAGP